MKQEVYFCFFVALLVTLFHQGCSKTIKKGYETDVTGTERWKYVTVRPGAHMFYWFYETTAANPKNTPIIIWLQGGPGGSSTGFGNFGELGPLDVNLKPRPTTWLSAAHLLFIDNPVGTGFSYADTEDAFTTNVDQIAKDLLNVVSDFFKDSPELSSNPLFIFSESYGGKMTAAFSVVLDQAVKSGAVRCNFVGLAMGDSWISPLDYVLTWGPYLYVTSLVDETQLAAINKTGMECKAAYDAGEYKKATELWSQTETQCNNLTGGVNFYNILKWGESDTSLKSTVKRDPNTLYYGWPEDLKKEVAKEAEKQTPIDKLFARHVRPMLGDALADLMNGQIRKKLGIIPGNVTWGGQSAEVFAKQSGDFMKPVIDRVDHLLSSTDLQVVVYNGQLDLICDTLGTERWVQKLQWPHLEDYNQATRDVITGKDGNPVAYHKKYERFNFYWILDAGHMVPADQGESALTMVKMVIGSE